MTPITKQQALQTVNSNVPANNAQSVGTSPQGSDAARLFVSLENNAALTA